MNSNLNSAFNSHLRPHMNPMWNVAQHELWSTALYEPLSCVALRILLTLPKSVQHRHFETPRLCNLSLDAAHPLVTFSARRWLLPRVDNFSHMYLTFIPSNGPICLSKCVCCALFPAWFVPLPSLQWAPLSPGVQAEASRYLYRPNSWGPPSQSSEGWRVGGGVEKLSWKLQVKPSVGNVSLLPYFFSLNLFSFSPFFFSQRPGQVMLNQTSGQISTHLKVIRELTTQLLAWVLFPLHICFLFASN